MSCQKTQRHPKGMYLQRKLTFQRVSFSTLVACKFVKWKQTFALMKKKKQTENDFKEQEHSNAANSRKTFDTQHTGLRHLTVTYVQVLLPIDVKNRPGQLLEPILNVTSKHTGLFQAFVRIPESRQSFYFRDQQTDNCTGQKQRPSQHQNYCFSSWPSLTKIF